MKFNKLFFSGFVLFGLMLASGASAATLYLSPSEGSFGPGDSFAVDIKIDTDKCVNTIEVYIDFPQNYLSLRDFIVGDSMLSLWIERPASSDMPEVNKRGVLHFIGGAPGGYCGKIPGDPGNSNIIGRMIFRVPGLVVGDNSVKSLPINFIKDKTKVLINDGFGTADKLELKNASFDYSGVKTQKQDSWQKQMQEDNIPPETFTIYLRKDKGVFGGKYYLIFNTVDKQSGIDHYEVLEIKPGEQVGVVPESGFIDRLFNKKPVAPKWQKAKTPYLLKDQSLSSNIKVKAFDKAGNERMVEYSPMNQGQVKPIPAPAKNNTLIYLLIGIIVSGVIIIIIFIIWLVIKKIKSRKKYEEE